MGILPNLKLVSVRHIYIYIDICIYIAFHIKCKQLPRTSFLNAMFQVTLSDILTGKE